MRRLQWIAAVGAGLLGGLHVALAFAIYRSVSLDALWFTGAGLGIVAVALMNIVSLRAEDRASPLIVAACNLVMTGFFAAAWSVMKGPQVVVGFALFAILTVCSGLAAAKRRPARETSTPA
jgi:hypothetical protein